MDKANRCIDVGAARTIATTIAKKQGCQQVVKLIATPKTRAICTNSNKAVVKQITVAVAKPMSTAMTIRMPIPQ